MRDSIYAIARYMLSPVHPSVTRMDQSKTVEVRSQSLHLRVAHDSSFLVLNLAVKFEREDRERGRRIREGYAENARLENARLELSAPNCRGWKMQDWKIRERERYGTPRVA